MTSNELLRQVLFAVRAKSSNLAKVNKIALLRMKFAQRLLHLYLLPNLLAYLYGRIQSPRPDVMSDGREGIIRGRRL